MNQRDPRREPPISLDELASTIDDSAIGRAARTTWRRLVSSVAESRLFAAGTRAASTVAPLEAKLLVAGYVLVVAMTVHLLLLALAEPYPFPGHSMYWLPGVLLIVGGLLVALRRPLAAAWRERQSTVR